jgi:RpiR family carbohydrate utilization transcriptional regulator
MYTPTISRIAALVVIDILSTSVAMRRPTGEQDRIHRMKRLLSDMRKMQPI